MPAVHTAAKVAATDGTATDRSEAHRRQDPSPQQPLPGTRMLPAPAAARRRHQGPGRREAVAAALARPFPLSACRSTAVAAELLPSETMARRQPRRTIAATEPKTKRSPGQEKRLTTTEAERNAATETQSAATTGKCAVEQSLAAEAAEEE